MDEPKKAYRSALIIGVAMIMSLFVYAVIAEFIKMNNEPFRGFSPFPEMQILKYILFGIVIVEFFLIRHVQSVILSGGLTPGRTPNTETAKLLSATIITYALCESVGLLGLILFLLGGSSFDFYSFMVLSLIFYGIHFPRFNRWENWTKESEKPV